MISKDAFRKQARTIRALQEDAAAAALKARDLFFDHVSPEPGAVIAGYWPVGSEFDVKPILREALARGYQCALPVMAEESRVLTFREWREDASLGEGPHGIQVPRDGMKVSPDIIIVPLLGFDEAGNRLGQGGGYYDATLQTLRAGKDILAVGLAYAAQGCLSGLPIETHDQRLDLVVTEQSVLDFRK